MAQLNIDPQQLIDGRIEPELLSKTYSIAAATLGVMQQQQIDGGARLQFQAEESGKASIVIQTNEVELRYTIPTVGSDPSLVDVKATFSEAALKGSGILQEDAQRAFAVANNRASELNDSGRFGVAVSPKIVTCGRGPYFQVLEKDSKTNELGMILGESITTREPISNPTYTKVQGHTFKMDDWNAARNSAANLEAKLLKEAKEAKVDLDPNALECYVVRQVPGIHVTAPGGSHPAEPHLRVAVGFIGERKDIRMIPIVGAADREGK
jgi:hypothetical protein